MANDVIKILRLVEKELISKEQGYILIKAHYENQKHDINVDELDNSALCDASEAAIENSAELIDELIEAARSSVEDWSQVQEYEKALEGFVKDVISGGEAAEETEEAADADNFVKKDYYLAGEKVYDQRNVSLKSIRKGKKYKANFFVYEIKESDGDCIPEKAIRNATLELIGENFCGRYRKIKNGNVIKIFVE